MPLQMPQVCFRMIYFTIGIIRQHGSPGAVDDGIRWHPPQTPRRAGLVPKPRISGERVLTGSSNRTRNICPNTQRQNLLPRSPRTDMICGRGNKVEFSSPKAAGECSVSRVSLPRARFLHRLTSFAGSNNISLLALWKRMWLAARVTIPFAQLL